MSSRILVFKNIAREGPGFFHDVALFRSIKLDVIELDRAEDIPDVNLFDGVIVCGGPDSANDDTEKMKKEIAAIERVIEARIPYFGICMGMQVLGKAAGATIVKSPVKEVGFIDSDGDQYVIDVAPSAMNDPIFAAVETPIDVFQLHGEMVVPNESTQVIATGKDCPVQAIKVGENAYGIQSHIEVTPDMFELWIHTDDDLNKLDKDELRNRYFELNRKYAQVGQQICHNFFDIVSS
jgi:GMP synthase-like glutamine amidotransferase